MIDQTENYFDWRSIFKPASGHLSRLKFYHFGAGFVTYIQ